MHFTPGLPFWGRPILRHHPYFVVSLFQNKYRVETTRLLEWDYASAGWYFVTICTRDMLCFFGEVNEGAMCLTSLEDVADAYWQEIPQHFGKAVLDAHIVMPNHMHGLLGIIADPWYRPILRHHPYFVVSLFQNKYRVETTRLLEWDYASAGWYFVTICTRDMLCFFGEVNEGAMCLTSLEDVADAYWQEIPQHFGKAVLDAHIVMPNHMHGLLGIIADPNQDDTHDVDPGRHRDVPCNVSTNACNITDGLKNTFMSEISPSAGSLGVMMRTYKAAVTRWSRSNGFEAFGWQARFHDHIIRSERAFQAIRTYILNNPLKWELDRNHPRYYERP